MFRIWARAGGESFEGWSTGQTTRKSIAYPSHSTEGVQDSQAFEKMHDTILFMVVNTIIVYYY